jgi:putative ABC transport system ATP-binding protein
VIPALSLRGVTKGYLTGSIHRPVLTGIDLDVAAGEVVALVGRSGSGKTTVLTLAAGLEAPDGGTVSLLGGALPATPAWAEVALLPQALGLLEELTIEENVRLPLRLGETPGLEAGELLERLGLAHLAARNPSEVSLGEQQRTALARAAIVQPLVLLADEPISHQNEAWGAEALALVLDLARAGTAVLLATHHPAALDVAGRALDVSEGRLRAVSARDRGRRT